MPDLLIELLSEEIPARMQPRARADLKRLVTGGLVEAGLTYAGAEAFSTPRRLALTVQGLTARSAGKVVERKGPAIDAPKQALEGFLRSLGINHPTPSALLDNLRTASGSVEIDSVTFENRKVKGRQVFYASSRVEGQPADAIVAEVVETAIRGFPWPKSMRWGEGSLRWVRPLRRILCVLSDEEGARTVPLEVGGIAAGNVTEGHPFMAPAAFAVTGFEDYARRLARANVVLDAGRRAETIRADAANLAFAAGGTVIADEALLEEVAGLVEWPVTLMGEIGEAFRDLPPEVLRTSMKEHQKFFSVTDAEGRITRFVTVADREAADDGATILAGNGRVLAARLADARFFWENDLAVARAGMEPWLEKLKAVTFHAKLGSQYERIERIAALAREIAPAVGADPEEAARAARLAKADLASEMVYEFPELQGIMGRYYALEAGEPEAVANAARDHYAPLGPSDEVPTGPVSVAVALADKIDTLTGFWAIDEKPTGSKDPYALRRAALGVVRQLAENSITVDLLEVLFDSLRLHDDAETAREARDEYSRLKDSAQELGVGFSGLTRFVRDNQTESERRALQLFSPSQQKTVKQFFDPSSSIRAILFVRDKLDLAENLLSFLHDRLKVFLRDRGVRHDVIDASLAMPGADDLALLTRRAEALQAFLGTPEGEDLVQGFRRADNILTQAEEADGVEYSYGPDPKLASTDEERALSDALDAAEPRIDAAMAEEDFAAAMGHMAALRAPVDAFFEVVQVNAEHAATRRNRLNLLHRIRAACLKVADLRRLEG